MIITNGLQIILNHFLITIIQSGNGLEKRLNIIQNNAKITQTGYWKLKLLQDEVTRHVKVYFVTPDEDGTLTTKDPAKKGRAIVEIDTDGSYVMTEAEIEESNKVKLFEHFIDDLKKLIGNKK
ncbi:MAG: BsaWI family type II restriction enzyme [Methanobacteriaceae archaeon]|nr:BsaWI family type II restriction enzyme [Methanobacteriaceae archaeon]